MKMSNEKQNFKQIITDTIQTVDELMECVKSPSEQMAQLRIMKWNLERILGVINRFEKMKSQIRKSKKHRTK